VLSPVVKQNPGWFAWPKREVSAEDVARYERYERYESEGVNGGEAPAE
jgi:hypothetical protein